MEQLAHALVPFAIFGFPAAVTVAFRWFKHRERMASLADAPHVSALEARLARMEQVLEAVGGEVERMGEGRRFVTRLLAERGAGPVPEASAARVRIPTPH